MSIVINDDAYFHWMIALHSGQVFKNSGKVFKYQHQYLVFKYLDI